jgi:hypothetical protein
MVNIGPGPEPAWPGPARFASPRPGKARAHGRPGKARAPAARITHAPGKQGLVPPLAQARTHCPRPVRPGTLTYTTHSHDSTARTGFAGAIRLHYAALRSRPQIALARLGPAQLTRITHGPNWGNPICYANY